MSVTSRKIFISHSWKHPEVYERLIRLLDEARDFEYHNYSMPKDSPIHTNRTHAELKAAITEQIHQVDVVVVLAGSSASYSEWMGIEIDIAKNAFEQPKPIVAIDGSQSRKTSQHVMESATLTVDWNSETIVSAIERCAP